MSDEEKEAIEWLKRLVKINKRDNLDNTFAEISLNLIEKQSKEIEHQIEKRANQKKELKEIYQTGYVNGCVSKVYEINKKCKDKIKAIIEELQEDIKYSANPLSIDNSKFAIKVLQSLLEKDFPTTITKEELEKRWKE